MKDSSSKKETIIYNSLLNVSILKRGIRDSLVVFLLKKVAVYQIAIWDRVLCLNQNSLKNMCGTFLSEIKEPYFHLIITTQPDIFYETTNNTSRGKP